MHFKDLKLTHKFLFDCLRRCVMFALLITTAAGILVAIPAGVGYNQLTSQLRDFGSRIDDFGRELLNAIENAAAYTPPPTLPQHGSEPRRIF